jgi:hypothetical protein
MFEKKKYVFFFRSCGGGVAIQTNVYFFYLSEKKMVLHILVIASHPTQERSTYLDLARIWLSRQVPPHVRVYMLYGEEKEDFRVVQITPQMTVIRFKIRDGLVPGIYQKTLAAIEYLQLQSDDTSEDWWLRTNLSTFINMTKCAQITASLPTTTPIYTGVPLGTWQSIPPDTPPQDMNPASGMFTVMNDLCATLLVTSKRYSRDMTGVPDDNLIGWCLANHNVFLSHTEKWNVLGMPVGTEGDATIDSVKNMSSYNAVRMKKTDVQKEVGLAKHLLQISSGVPIDMDNDRFLTAVVDENHNNNNFVIVFGISLLFFITIIVVVIVGTSK